MKPLEITESIRNFIPKDKKIKLLIDVGTSIDAPNSASWLLQDEDNYVIGIEPCKGNREKLRDGRFDSPDIQYLALNSGLIYNKGEVVGSIDGRFLLLPCGIDDTLFPRLQQFYETNEINTGCSSFLKPTDKLEAKVERVTEVLVMSLADILQEIVPHVDEIHLKVDAQGKDFDVLMSAGGYLDNIQSVVVEMDTMGCYEDACRPQDIHEYMLNNNFELYGNSGLDYMYVRTQ